MQFPSPLETAPALSSLLGINLRIKRDDLLPFLGGGNKVRKTARIMRQAADLGCNAVVTTGGMQSNHARVVALMAAQRGWKCGLVLHGGADVSEPPRGNLLLMRLVDAEIKVVPADRIGWELESAMADFGSRGFKAYLIPGGGHCVEGALAYVDAAQEMARQCESDGWQPDWIVHASGTGTTQAGLLAGVDEIGLAAEVVGVSVARHNPRGGEVVQKAYEEVCQRLGRKPGTNRVRFLDAWVGQGYETADPNVFSAIRYAAEAEGLVLDPTYTGRAFLAVVDLVKAGKIPPGSNVLFWHTGGLLNLLASRYVGEILEA